MASYESIRDEIGKVLVAGAGITVTVDDPGNTVTVASTGAVPSAAWDGSHLRLGTYRLWVDSTGDLRIKSSAPTSDTDGTVVGTQS